MMWIRMRAAMRTKRYRMFSRAGKFKKHACGRACKAVRNMEACPRSPPICNSWFRRRHVFNGGNVHNICFVSVKLLCYVYSYVVIWVCNEDFSLYWTATVSRAHIGHNLRTIYWRALAMQVQTSLLQVFSRLFKNWSNFLVRPRFQRELVQLKLFMSPFTFRWIKNTPRKENERMSVLITRTLTVTVHCRGLRQV